METHHNNGHQPLVHNSAENDDSIKPMRDVVCRCPGEEALAKVIQSWAEFNHIPDQDELIKPHSRACGNIGLLNVACTEAHA